MLGTRLSQVVSELNRSDLLRQRDYYEFTPADEFSCCFVAKV